MQTETTRVFTRQELGDLQLPWKAGVGGEVISDVEFDERRWYVWREITFRLAGQPEGEAWRLSYKADKTEIGDIDKWDDEQEVTATLVRKVTKMVEVWEWAAWVKSPCLLDEIVATRQAKETAL